MSRTNHSSRNASTGFEADAFGRPADPELRTAALAAMLGHSGWDASVEVLHDLSFWEECLAGSLGCDLATLGFARSPEGPRSPYVTELTTRWIADGTLTRNDDYEAEADPALHLSTEAFGKGHPLRGDPKTPWWRLMDGFLDAWNSKDPDGPHVSPMHPTDDVRVMMACDPTFRDGAWEKAGPAGSAEARMPMGELVAGVRSWRQRTLLKPYRPEHAGWYLGRLLCKRASERSLAFGAKDYLSAVKAHRVRETDVGEGRVEAEFIDASGTVQAWATFEPQATRGPDAQPGRLISVRRAPGPKAAGLDEVALRHAATRGARIVPAPDDIPGDLLARHGNRRGDGGYLLCRVTYPVCAPSARGGAAHAS